MYNSILNQLYTWVASYFIWNVELHTFDLFLCICTHDDLNALSVGPNWLALPQFHKNTKIGINELPDRLHTWAGIQVIQNVQLNVIHNVLCICAINLGFQGLIIPKHTKTGITRLLDGL